MKTNPAVSIIIPYHKKKFFFIKTIESIINQNFKRFEVLIIYDDDNLDELNFIKKIKKKYSKVKLIINKKILGPGLSRNKGIILSKGKYVAFCDADDIWQPDKLARQMPEFRDKDVGVVYSEVAYINDQGFSLPKEPSTDRESGWVTSHLVIKNFIPFGTAVMRRACIDRHGGFDENLPMGIDWDLWLRFSVAWKFMYVPEVTYLYRIWPGQMSKNYRGRYENAFKILNKFLSANPEAVPPVIIARAWADMYVGRAMCVAQAEKTIIEPLSDLVRGLRYDMTYYLAWKSLAKLFLRRV